MQFIALIINLVLNIALLVYATSNMTVDNEEAVEAWHFASRTSAALMVANLIFSIARMVYLWRRGRKEASLWGLVVLVVLGLEAYYLWGRTSFWSLLPEGLPLGIDH